MSGLSQGYVLEYAHEFLIITHFAMSPPPPHFKMYGRLSSRQWIPKTTSPRLAQHVLNVLQTCLACIFWSHNAVCATTRVESLSHIILVLLHNSRAACSAGGTRLYRLVCFLFRPYIIPLFLSSSVAISHATWQHSWLRCRQVP